MDFNEIAEINLVFFLPLEILKELIGLIDCHHGLRLCSHHLQKGAQPGEERNLLVEPNHKMKMMVHRDMLSGWWLSPTPLKNDGLRQLGKLTFPIYGGKKSCPKPPTSYHIYIWWIDLQKINKKMA